MSRTSFCLLEDPIIFHVKLVMNRSFSIYKRLNVYSPVVLVVKQSDHSFCPPYLPNYYCCQYAFANTRYNRNVCSLNCPN